MPITELICLIDRPASEALLQIYFINLARETSRRAHMERQLAALGLAAERIEAVTPADIDEAMLARHCDASRTCWLTPPELACTLSRVRVFERLLASGAAHALVLEDDAVLSKRLGGFLRELDASGMPVDLLRLETYNLPVRLGRRGEAIGGYEMYGSSSLAFGTAGYVLTRDAAAALLGWTGLFRKPTDHALFAPFDWVAKTLTVRHLVPGLVIQIDRLDTETELRSGLELHRATKLAADTRLGPRRLVNRLRRWFYDEIVVGGQKTWRQLRGEARKRVVPFLAE